MHVPWGLELPLLPWGLIDLDVPHRRLFKVVTYSLSVHWMPGTVWYSLPTSQVGEQAERDKQMTKIMERTDSRIRNPTLIWPMLNPLLWTVIVVFPIFSTFSTLAHNKKSFWHVHILHNNSYIFIKQLFMRVHKALWKSLLHSTFSISFWLWKTYAGWSP